MSEPTEFVLLVSDSSYVRLTKTIVVQLHGIGLEEAYHLLKSGGHLSSAWSLEDFFSAVHGQQVPDLTRPIPTPAHTHQEGMIPFAFGDELVRAKLDAEGAPWFVAKDICRVLEIVDHHQAIATPDEDERGRSIVQDARAVTGETPFNSR